MNAFRICVAGIVAAFFFAAIPALAAPDRSEAEQVFAVAKTICDRDRGAFWGRSLCGPMLLVDPKDRAVIANVADTGGVLKRSGEIFVGTLPDEVIVADTPTDWSGTRWTQLMMPVTQDVAKRDVTLAHELFHRIQPDLQLIRPEENNGHLDTLNGRYLMQLEWRALSAALSAVTPAARSVATADALLFRAQRYHLFPEAAADEAALEINEGIPEYTGVMLGLAHPGERIAYAIVDLWSWTLTPSFVRSFAYATGPAYGLLLDRADANWRTRLGSGQRLDQLLADAAHILTPNLARVAGRTKMYDDGTLLAAEQQREKVKQRELAQFKAALVDGPVLILPLRNSIFGFNPQTLRSLEGIGTVYPTMRLVDDWGILEVESHGALVSEKIVRVSAAGIDSSALKGPGWKLTLKPGWTIEKSERPGDLAVVHS